MRADHRISLCPLTLCRYFGVSCPRGAGRPRLWFPSLSGPRPSGELSPTIAVDVLLRADRLEVMLAGEQPSVAVYHALAMSLLPPLTQQREQILGEHGVAISAALAVFDPEPPE